jgi:hypothetical protein
MEHFCLVIDKSVMEYTIIVIKKYEEFEQDKKLFEMSNVQFIRFLHLLFKKHD